MINFFYKLRININIESISILIEYKIIDFLLSSSISGMGSFVSNSEADFCFLNNLGLGYRQTNSKQLINEIYKKSSNT